MAFLHGSAWKKQCEITECLGDSTELLRTVPAAECGNGTAASPALAEHRRSLQNDMLGFQPEHVVLQCCR